MKGQVNTMSPETLKAKLPPTGLLASNVYNIDGKLKLPTFG